MFSEYSNNIKILYKVLTKYSVLGQANKAIVAYLWLHTNDHCRYLTDKHILEQSIAFSKADIIKYKEAHSLGNETGECPNITIDIEVIE